MQQMVNQTLVIFGIALGIALIYLLAPILTPFLLGAIIAYLANPLVKRLEGLGLHHMISVVIVFFLMISAFFILILLLYPIVQKQVNALINAVPEMANALQNIVIPWLKEYINVETIKTTVTTSISKAGWVFTTIVGSGYTIIEAMVNFLLTIVVAFYLLRDWDSVLKGIDNLLPKSIRPTVNKLAKECDDVLGAFFRGQLLVMLALCLIYGIGLTLVGLQVGLMIGIIGGLLSIVPFLGSIFVVITASVMALVQFGDWHQIVWVLIVYLIGQGIEGYVLTPYLIGERIGLHPVAVIFSIMAGGTLFGFFGILLALPVASIIMVLVRHFNRRYHASKFYSKNKA